MAKPKPAALTPAFLRHVRPPETGQVEYADGACPGLRLRLSPGSAPWVLGCRDAAGRARRFTLGQFPIMGLKEARDAARTLRQEVRTGRDPIAEARVRRAAEQARNESDAVDTLADVIRVFGEQVGHRWRSWPVAMRKINSVFGRKLTRPASEVVSSELQLVIDSHASAASAGVAVRYFKPILRWAAKRDLMRAGLAEALEQPKDASRVRQRALSRDEIRAILGAIGADASTHASVLKWLFWTAARLNEACEATWANVDRQSGLWTIPTTKTGRPHQMPLPQQALALLRDIEAANARIDPARSDPGALIFANATGRRLEHWDRATKRLQTASGTAGWHRHDIRRTVATVMGDLAVAPHVIERALSHTLRTSADGTTVGKIAATYNTSRYRNEHAAALQGLADELDRIVDGVSNVVRLAK